MAKTTDRTHVLDTHEELMRYMYASLLAFETQVYEEVSKKFGDKLTEDELEKIDKIVAKNMMVLSDNIKCMCGEYHALVEEGKVAEIDQYKPQVMKIGKVTLTVDDLRKRIMAQVEDIENTFGGMYDDKK